MNAHFDPDTHYGDEHLSYFEHSTGGLWPDDFSWMLRAAVVKDAVTAFDVYMEESIVEAMGRRGLEFDVKDLRPSPPWPEVVKLHKMIGNDLSTERVRHIRGLRHLLTHQRGIFRTQKLLEKYSEAQPPPDGWDDAGLLEPLLADEYVGSRVPLKPETLEQILKDLHSTVRDADKAVWAISWADAPAPELDALRATLLANEETP
ncbi:hypothetical protein GCM10022221_81980 [Actinocorallia aurea]